MELLFIGAYLVLAVLVFLMFRVLKKSVDKVSKSKYPKYFASGGTKNIVIIAKINAITKTMFDNISFFILQAVFII